MMFFKPHGGISIVLAGAAICCFAFAMVFSDKFDMLAPLSYAAPIYAVCCIPVFLILAIIYVITMKVRKKSPIRIIHWLDPLSLLAAPSAWACFEHVGQAKSLSNIIEFAIIGWVWCICMAIRYARSIMERKNHERYYGHITFAIVILAAVLLAIFFPTFPE